MKTLGKFLIGVGSAIVGVGEALSGRRWVHPSEQSNAELDGLMNGNGSSRPVPDRLRRLR